MAGEVYDSWPAGATWVFQGTVAEDATAGTHVCTLTVTPGAGNEIQVLYGQVLVGNTATAQTAQVFVDDGTNVLSLWGSVGFTTALSALRFPTPGANPAAGASGLTAQTQPWIVSGTMRLILSVSTAAVSVTQTFAVVCRIKGAVPTAVLLDTIGTSTNTVNTNKVF